MSTDTTPSAVVQSTDQPVRIGRNKYHSHTVDPDPERYTEFDGPTAYLIRLLDVYDAETGNQRPPVGIYATVEGRLKTAVLDPWSRARFIDGTVKHSIPADSVQTPPAKLRHAIAYEVHDRHAINHD